MEFSGADADSRAIEVEVDSVAAFAARLRELVGMVGRANAAVYGPRTGDFAGAGPPGASRLHALNAAGLRDLVDAVERLDDAVVRLRDAAEHVAAAYARSDAFAAATTQDARAGWDG